MSARIDYSRLSTEQPNPRSARLDRLSAIQLVRLMNREDQRVVRAVARAAVPIARAAEWVAASFRQGGRLFLVGAGTSGRLAVLEAAECPPTFNSDRVIALMAGGRQAVFRSQEGAEDDGGPAQRAIHRQARRGDVVVGIAASGVTAFARTALEAGKRRGARTILLTCNTRPLPIRSLDLRIVLDVGPEILTGSTRLKSGTACKMALNMLTTVSMVRWGKVFDHWMVDLQPKSRKLVARGIRLVQQLGGVSERDAEKLFRDAGRRVKPAILMARRGIDYAEATRRLKKVDGFLRRAIEWR
jgi:N-acetylmuramic acid 6-phosphate etherase